jgi:putative ABC transport system permease protein
MALVLGRSRSRPRRDLITRMPTRQRLARLVRTLFRRPQAEAEMEEEMRLHIELETEELIQKGVAPAEARRQASLAFGGVQQRKEDALEDGSFWWIDDMRRDVRIAARTLLRHPTFAITATLALALAIAVNTTMFSVLDAMINPNVGAGHPEQLYSLRYWGFYGKRLGPSAPDLALAAGGKTYSGYTTGGYYSGGGVVERGNLVRHAAISMIRTDFFRLLEVSPLEGTLTPSSDAAVAATTIVISDRLRTDVFRPGESPIGQSLNVDGTPLRVIGVVRYYGALSAINNDIWVFPAPTRRLSANLIRLREGISAADAERELNLLAARIALGEHEDPKDSRFQLTPITQQFAVTQFHYALIGAGIAVLIVACTNLANLQLVRGIGRAGELALRSALGASRRQIIVQLMIESGVLTVSALVLALLFAVGGNALIHATIPPHIGQYVVEPQTSARMVVFAATTAAFSLVIVGLAPAIRVSRVEINTMLKSRAGTGAHRANQRTYGGLVIAQIALTLPLVCAAVLLSRSALRMSSPDYHMREQFGFNTTPLIVASIILPPNPDAATPIAELSGTIISMARATPGVTDAAIQFGRSFHNNSLAVDDNDGAVRDITNAALSYIVVSPSYFRTMGLPIERGKGFDEGGHTEPMIIMDRGSGWFLWPRSSPIGRVMKLGESHWGGPWIKVVGIVGDSLSEDARDIRRVIDTLRVNNVYRVMTLADSEPASQRWRSLTMYVRAPKDQQRVASALRRKLRGIAAMRQPQVELFDDYRGIPQRTAVLKFIASLFATFGILALGLSALGVYGIVAQSVTDRQREVAVRIALGATPRSIVRALIREGNVLVLAGVAIGLYMTKETIGWLGEFLGELDLTNAFLFGLLCVALFSAMVLSAFIPAFRATKLDPMEVLRAE